MLRRATLTLILGATLASPTRAFDTQARSAWVYDVNTGTVLLEKDADRALPPASMSKLMTLFMLFEALRDGRVTMDTAFTVSTKAKDMGGSTMYLDERDRPTVQELILGIIVNSGNDACVVVAENLAGSEEAFARQMTERARAIGLTHTTLANASGWPHPDHRMSMRDLGTLTTRILTEFPEYYSFFNIRENDYKNRAPDNRHNRNPLFRVFPTTADNAGAIRADGLKTGHTQEAGFGLVGSAVQGDRRVIVVISGLDLDSGRSAESEKIVNWAFRNFTQRVLAPNGVEVARADVWLGAAPSVGLVPAQEVSLLVPALAQDQIKLRAVYTGPLSAPIAAGQQVGELIVTVPDMPDTRVPLLAAAAVEKAGVMARVQVAARILIARAATLAAF